MIQIQAQPIDITIKKIKPNTWPLLGILIGVTVLVTLILYPKIVVIHSPYKIGDIADKNIRAAIDFTVEDTDTLAQKRSEASGEVLTVYNYDKTILASLTRQVNEAFTLARSNIEIPKAGPGNDTQKTAPSETPEEKNKHKVWEVKPEFEKILGIPVDDGAYGILEKEKFSKKISDLIIAILSEILNNGVVANKELLLKEEKGITLKTVGTDFEIAVQNLKHYYGLDQAKAMVRIVGEPFLKGLDYNLVNLIVDFTERLIQPNIIPNKTETDKRKQEAENKISPIFITVKKGEMVLREGDRVTAAHLLKIKALQEETTKKHELEKGIGTALIILAMLTLTYLIHLKHRRDILYYQNKNLFFIGSVVIIFVLILKISVSLAQTLVPDAPVPITAASLYYGIPLAAAAMTICQFLGFTIAFPFAIVMAMISGIVFEKSYELCLYFLLNGIVGAYLIQNCRDRKAYITAGSKIGLLNVVLATMIDIYTVDFSGMKLIWDWAFGFIGGVSAGIVTAGITPMMEMAFGYTTDSTLQELSNLDQPLLRRLMLEAPGTYHHSIIVGSMVEAAAGEIGANPLLAKVSGYYHDIGKLKNPLYFIENQRDGKNIHNKLAPSMSCLVLISHVKNGVELARENKLGQQIIDAIVQHHGTTLISFFYEKAKKLKKDQVVNIDDFRYPGPTPQTRETALVMLADVVEAATRSLELPTPSRIQGLVQQLINKIFSDNQLDDCPLTLKDLHSIARSFNKILNGIYHHRVEYPEPTPPESKENNDSDRQPTETAQAPEAKDTEDSANPLKRLGQS
jgi:putative nucleotidyltransferase with HDIG domain